MRLIDADELIKERVENDPVRIAAMCAPTVYVIDDKKAEDIKQAIEYFKAELTQMGILSIICFWKAEVRACRTAIKVLQSIQEGSQKGQQNGSRQCAISHG